ncbi:UNVERIFIED_CONTAM: hypothetical protein PYX00_006993 [Menopon gallinae]|uniref:Reverse transcriptase domain-containing protein n=1 Tax=Menopon gallinae TaxID=328185 RepID=A0AAW2HHU8_9NEOP
MERRYNRRNQNQVAAESQPAPVVTKNRFEILSEEESDEEGEVKQKIKPPPIVIKNKLKHEEIQKIINENARHGCKIKYNSNSVCIYTNEKSDWNLIKNDLTERKVEYHTYTDKSEKTHGFVIKGLDNDPTPDEIKENIETHNISVIKIFKMNGTKRPLFLVITKSDITLNILKNKINYITNIKVTWERHQKRKKITQCHRCQRWGHSTSNCNMRARCLKCGEEHWTKECTKNKEIPAKCANCGGDHPANSEKCRVYVRKLEEKETRQKEKKPTAYTLRKEDFPPLTKETPQGTPTWVNKEQTPTEIFNNKPTTGIFITEKDIDIMILTETKLQQTDKLKIKNYKTYRQDREGPRGGGVAILVKENVPHTPIGSLKSNIENYAIKTVNDITIVGAYNRPLNHMTDRDLANLIKTNRKVIIAGDLNARHTDWNCHRNNKNGNTLKKFTEKHNAIIHYPDSPTHYPENNGTPTTIDIIINKNIITPIKPISLPELDSDHNPVVFELPPHSRNERTTAFVNLKHTDWERYRRDLDKLITINNKIRNPEEVEHEVTKLTRAITKAKAKNTRTEVLKQDKIPNNIKILIKNKNELRKKWQITGDPELKREYNKYKKSVDEKIKNHRNEQWTKLIETLKAQDGSLWKLTKRLRRTFHSIPALTTGTQTHYTDKEKARVLANAFETVHKIDTTNNTEEQKEIANKVTEAIAQKITINKKQYEKLITNPNELKEIIKKLPKNKAPGPDQIGNQLIKNLSRKAVVQLMYIINAIIKYQHYPSKWKIAEIIPIIKPNKDETKPDSYRPISLLPSISKVTEKVILNRLEKLDKKLRLTPDEQFGFRQNHSTTQQVGRIVTDVTRHFNRGHVTAMLLLDIQKAFDRVWIDGLLYKLIDRGTPTHIVKLLHSYLTGRRFRVRVNDATSEYKTVEAGVPQGSVLGPKLYNFFTCDVPKFEKTNLALYADDTAIYAHSFSAVVANKQLQIHLDILTDYYKKWHIQINPNKTENIIFCRKYTNNKIFSKIKCNGHGVSPKSEVKYLGVTLDQRLNFDRHINKLTQTANGVIKNIYPLISKRSKLSQKNKKLLYLATIRPILTYAVPLWGNIGKTRLLKPQRLQNRCLRLITNGNRYTKIKTLHEITGVPRIEEFVRKLSINFYNKLSNTSKLTKQIIREVDAEAKHKLPYHNIRHVISKNKTKKKIK